MMTELKSHTLQVRGAEDAEIFKALGSETRLEILALLAGGDRNIAEICLELNLSQPKACRSGAVCATIG
jgi:DNA-binding transcriptional ArsR family regulator